MVCPSRCDACCDTLLSFVYRAVASQSAYLKAALEELLSVSTAAWFNAEGVADDISIVVGLIGGTAAG